MLAAILLCSCGKDGKIAPGDTTPVTDGNWIMTGEWTIARAQSGDETLRVSAAEDSTAWNTFFNLADDWTVSADVAATAGKGDGCTRLVFGDDYGNVCLAVTAQRKGENTVTLRADERVSTGWRMVYECKEPIKVDLSKPLNISVKRVAGSRKLDVSLSQNGEMLESAKTKTMQDRLSSMLTRPGLSVYHTEAEFTNFAVSAKRGQTVVKEDEAIIPGENVPTDEWLLGENAIHNILNGGSAIIIDGEGENHAWNLVNELGDAWTLTFTTEFGTSYRDSVCSRYMFGPTADVNSDYCGLVTVNYIHNQVMLQIENKDNGAWTTVGGVFDWKNINGRKVTVKICKYAGINRIAVFVLDGERNVITEFSDEIPADQIAKYKHYGVMTYSSQCRFSEFGFEPTADESTMPPITERVYDKISDLTIGAAEKTNDWKLSNHSTYFHEDGKPCLVVDSKGDEFSYYKKNSLGNKWSISTKIDFGTYYSSVPGARVAFTTADTKLVSLLTIKYAPNDSCINAQLQTMTNDVWSDVFKVNWTPGASSLILEINGDNSGKVNIVIRSAFNNDVLLEKSATLSKDVVERMKVAALATTSTQVKYSDIQMNLTGPAVNITGGGGGHSGVMYAITTGTPGTSSVWDTGTGMTYYTDNSMVISSNENLYSYNRTVEIADGFNFSTDILYGPLDAKGLSTARIAMVDKFYGMAGLITVKFSENYEILVEGQYNSGGTWYNCISDKSWHAVASNKIHVNVSRADGSNNIYLTITDSAGNRVFSATLAMPKDAAQKICYLGIGVDKSKVKFSNMSLTATKTENGNQNNFGMDPIEETGNVVSAPAGWQLDSGAKVYDDGSVIVNSTGNAYAKQVGSTFGEGFTITTKIQFGKLDSKGLSTARLGLINSNKDLIALFTLKFSQNTEVMVEGQYQQNSTWTNIIYDNAWRKVANNIITATVHRDAGSDVLHLTLTDSKGVTFYDVTTTAIPTELVSTISSYSLGCENTEVKYSDIVTDAVKDDFVTEEIEIGEIAAASGWTTGDGTIATSDGAMIFYKAGGETTATRTEPLAEEFTLGADIVFGTADANGNATARIYLLDESGNKMVRLYLTLSSKHVLTVQGTYNGGDAWTEFGTASCTLKSNHLRLSITKTAEGGLDISVADTQGVGTSLSGAAIPAEVLAKIAKLAVGSFDSRVKFCAITVS